MEKKNKTSLSEYPSSDIRQHEDAVLKTSMQFFADEILPYLGIQGKVISFAPTELIHLELQKLFQDFNFVMEDGTWKHFEFQSTNEGLDGLKRFRAYEALTSYQHKVIVETYVLFSGNIKKDLIPLVLCPLMSGDIPTKDRISKAYRIIRKSVKVGNDDTAKIEAMLYAMADKFLDTVDLENLKEEMSMTRLGQMIWEDAINDTLKKRIKIKLEKGKNIEEIAEDLEETPELIKELIKTL